MRDLGAILSALLAVLPAAARAEEAPAPPAGTAAPIGLTLTGSLAGGGAIGESGLFEAEVVAGYELGGGFRPELGLLLNFAPGTFVGLRPGLHYTLSDLPFYVRGALDWAYPSGHGQVRWLLLGGGVELRLTGLYGLFGEVDTGIPLSSGAGVPIELRAGVSLRF